MSASTTSSILAAEPNYYRSIKYPSPFFDLSTTYLPDNIKDLFQWCEFYFLTNPLVNTVITKLAEYPITDILIEHEDEKIRNKWEAFTTEKLKLRSFCIETGWDYYTFGIAYVSLKFPFVKELKCPSCKTWFSVEGHKNRWKFHNLRFSFQCPKCQARSSPEVRDVYLKNIENVGLMRWNPRQVTIAYNELTGESNYYYKPPGTLINDLQLGLKDIVVNTPQVIIESIRHPGRSLELVKSNLYVLKRPSLSSKDTGYGVPAILPVLKDLYYLQTLKRAQEAIATEHIIPLRTIFPQAASPSGDPIGTLNLTDWRREVRAELANWKRDCVSPDTFVETSRGLVPAKDVIAGDLLLDHTGSHTRINRIWERPLREGERAYRIKARGLSVVDSVYSANHPIWAAKSFNNGHGHKLGQAEFIDIKDLRPHDYVGYPIKPLGKTPDLLDLADHVEKACTEEFIYIDHDRGSDTPKAFEFLLSGPSDKKRKHVLKEKGWSVTSYEQAQNAVKHGRDLRRLPRLLHINEEFSWVCGLYLAEGSTNKKQVQFSLNINETDLVDRLDRFFYKVFNSYGITSKKTENGIQRIYSSVVAAQLFRSLCPGTALNKRIPELFRKGGKESALALLSGMLAGDGCFHKEAKKSTKTTYKTSSVQLAEDARQLLLSLGIICGVSLAEEEGPRIIAGRKCYAHRAYTLQVSGSYDKLLQSMLDGTKPPTELWSRIGLFRDGYIWHRVRDVEIADTATVIGFDVKSDTFCTWGVATHNSNYIPVLGFPLGTENIGGDGRALLLAQEIQTWSDLIVSGMGVPIELIRGGVSWSGSSVSLRILENKFLCYIAQLEDMLSFVINTVSAYTGWDKPKAKFRAFKMADDLQRKMFLLQLNQGGKISDKTLLQECDLEVIDEEKLMKGEATRRALVLEEQQKQMAEIQGKAMLTQGKYQQKMQEEAQKNQEEMAQAPPEGGMPPGGQMEMNLEGAAEKILNQLQGMVPADATKYMAALKSRYPDLAGVVTNLVTQRATQAQQPQQPGVQQGGQMAALPEQRPPRRELSPI